MFRRTIELENKLGREDGCGYEGEAQGICADGTVLYLACGGGYLTLHLAESHRTTHMHT